MILSKKKKLAIIEFWSQTASEVAIIVAATAIICVKVESIGRVLGDCGKKRTL